ncbi:FAD-dependent oxidoreductase [Phycicoccus endophyticus]|uniref:FAD-dependent oxidoreductase n=1 Tax=Phycicoccus endophyticus TaxID=1690220 RepID=A0A7G9R1R5_9MICO|nr:FAD-dependent oxidoreductase [Phycicoccus endophyticus]NHI18667.1 FAD-dependent oxidoreductase [Phycicoccus endophyticus]QNN49540.1 FAD-dependent oxidoreductase [Phycicoccus endophyticus]
MPASATVPPHARRRVAVVGSGVSGLTAAHVLATRDDVTLYEADDRLGGHAHTHTVAGRHGELAVDSGFIVHNDRTYPLLSRLLRELGVATRDTEMSMSIRDERRGLEYAGGRGVRGFVARPRQLLDAEYLGMLGAVRRFHGLAARFLAETDDEDTTTYGEFIRDAGLPEAFTRLYAVPVVACVWSSGGGAALEYPARYLFRFLEHHGMLSVGDSPQWRTVVGGSRTYVDRLVSRLPAVHSGDPVTAVTRTDDGVEIRSASGRLDRHDGVVMATHADDALRLLVDATPAEKEILGAFRYSRNETVLHRDGSLMPRARLARASWNYLVDEDESRGAVVTYWMNRLQGLPADDPLYVTLNATERIDPARVVATMEYTHPLYDLEAVRAQRRLPELSTERTAFAGAYHGWGFHEDGCRSGVEAARAFGVTW